MDARVGLSSLILGFLFGLCSVLAEDVQPSEPEVDLQDQWSEIRVLQADYEGKLVSRRADLADKNQELADWEKRIQQAVHQQRTGVQLKTPPSQLYDEINIVWKSTRASLRDILVTYLKDEVDIPTWAGELESTPPLLKEVRLEAERLKREERRLRTRTLVNLRSNMISYNQNRLVLFDLMEDERVALLRGFGPDGVKGARSELDHMSLQVRSWLVLLPKQFEAIKADFSVSPIPVLWAAIKLIILLLAFRLWRSHADAVLGSGFEHFAGRQPPSMLTRFLSSGFWYLRRVRKPLELLVLSSLSLGVLKGIRELPEYEYLWLVLMWLLLGLSIVLYLDAIATRYGLQAGEGTSTSELRIRSLRLIGISVVATGLVLTLTVKAVGVGTIYAWVIRTFWILAIPVLWVVTRWWRATILASLDQEKESSGLLAWLASKAGEKGRILPTALGGLALLLRGVVHWAIRRVSGLEDMRRILAYLFRREVSRQADIIDGQDLGPIPQDIFQQLDPASSGELVLPEMANEQVDQLLELISGTGISLSAVVGERGSGKFSFLRQIQLRSDADRVTVITCPAGGFDPLMKRFAEHFGAPSASEDDVAAAIAGANMVAVCLDNTERLVKPAIGGLGGFDRLSALARRVDSEIAWIAAVASPTWQFIRRARGGRLFFDRVIELASWSEEDIGRLIQQRCETLDVHPSFEELMVPRQLDAPNYSHTERTELGFYRILWDYSKGNPMVALHFWRESLRLDGDGNFVVRLFEQPDASEMTALSLNFLFVLRAILQMDLAREIDIVECTQLPKEDVADALRFGLARGYVNQLDGFFRVSLHWYRTISNHLKRQHLLVL